MSKKFFIKLITVMIASFLFYVIYSAYSIWSFADENQLIKADAAIVLGAAVWNDEPSPVFKERIKHAIWLYEHEYVEKIIFTGGKNNDKVQAESEVAKSYALKHHIPEKNILIESESAITEENLYFANEIAKENNLHTFLLVSDPLYMKRAMKMGQDLKMNVYSSPTQTSAYESFSTKLPFFFRELFFYLGYQLTLPFR